MELRAHRLWAYVSQGGVERRAGVVGMRSAEISNEYCYGYALCRKAHVPNFNRLEAAHLLLPVWPRLPLDSQSRSPAAVSSPWRISSPATYRTGTSLSFHVQRSD